LCGAGGLAIQLGLALKANAYLDAAVEMCRALIRRHEGDGETAGSDRSTLNLLAEVQRTLASALHWRGTFTPSPDHACQARADLEESIAIFRRLGDASGLALALNALGFHAIKHGDFASARSALMESLSLFWRAGNRWGVTQASINLAAMAERQGDYDQLRSILAESLSPTMACALGPFLEVFATTWWLACLAQMQRGNARVLERFGKDLLLVKELGYQEYLWRSLYETALPIIAADAPARAVRLAAAAQALHEQADVPGVNRQKLDAWLFTVRTTLGRVAFDRAWAEGERMTLEQAAACAPCEGE
jgi:tetratricopeptide (TPR) repeat protein